MRNRILGLDRNTPLLDGTEVRYVNLDNAASTPPFIDVVNVVDRFMPYYSSVHRGTGFKSRLSTMVYDQSRETIGRFVNADPSINTVIFGKNATEAINKLSHRLPHSDECVVLTTILEHHSNDLPWRDHFRVVHVGNLPDGRLDERDFDRKLSEHKGRTALVAVTGAANVTGFLPPIHRLARKAHEAGSLILIDAAQLAPHRRIDMKPDDHPEHLDFVILSAHKMYAPFGTGALIGPRQFFLDCGPDYSGGGTVNVVTPEDVYWADLPERDEAGSPNVVGALAMAKSARVLVGYGMDRIAEHERELTVYALSRLKEVQGIRIYGESNPSATDRIGVIPFNIDGIHHALLAAILGYEGGIGVRSGCFCAHPYVVSLLELDQTEIDRWKSQFLAGNKSDMPGMVRMSLGCYSNEDDVDRLIDMLHRVVRGEYEGEYQVHEPTGEFFPIDYDEPFARYFSLENDN
jgi:selenocysteine lyase/cysteine desulfurase